MLLPPAVAKRAPSGRTATAVTGPSCASLWIALPSATFHTSAVPSRLPERIRGGMPGTPASEVTGCSWPASVTAGAASETSCEVAAATFHIRIRLSAPPAATCEPSPTSAIVLIAAGVVTPPRAAPSATRQARRDLSVDPENKRLESAAKHSDVTGAECAAIGRAAAPLAASHSFTWPSLPPVASSLPSGLTAKAPTDSGDSLERERTHIPRPAPQLDRAVAARGQH